MKKYQELGEHAINANYNNPKLRDIVTKKKKKKRYMQINRQKGNKIVTMKVYNFWMIQKSVKTENMWHMYEKRNRATKL